MYRFAARTHPPPVSSVCKSSRRARCTGRPRCILLRRTEHEDPLDWRHWHKRQNNDNAPSRTHFPGRSSQDWLDRHSWRKMVGSKSTIPISRHSPHNSSSFCLQALLGEMVSKNVSHVAMEVSSHALSLERVRACDFVVACLTNVTQDHLDFHKTMENYGKQNAYCSRCWPRADRRTKQP